jgi:hypothetical protein
VLTLWFSANEYPCSGGGGMAEQDRSWLGGGGMAEQDRSWLGGGGIAERDRSWLGGGGMAEQDRSWLGGGGIAEQDRSWLGGGGMAEQDKSWVGGGGMAERDGSMRGGGGITEPARVVRSAPDSIELCCAFTPVPSLPRPRKLSGPLLTSQILPNGPGFLRQGPRGARGVLCKSRVMQRT